ncbi:hypothetical protein [Burkholderia plantarii]|uniref:hypothetical protein n=1 Tax=Burkholderia plantarii TaxID=41899 RepID=UPI000A969AC6|nr:hypothetical protein [Burkholderia plantarii]
MSGRARRLGGAGGTGWDAPPAGKLGPDLGDAWLDAGGTALPCVPSVIVPEAFNVLIDPAHAGARESRAAKLRRWRHDARVGARRERKRDR